MAESSQAFEPGHLIGHVKDAEYFDVPRFFQRFDALGLIRMRDGRAEVPVPQPFGEETPTIQVKTGFAPLDDMVEPLDFRLTKFMVLEVATALILAAIFIPLARKVRGGGRPRGRFWNLFEAMLLFLRDEVVRPSVGGREGDRFLPFIWTMFFFILGCNLFGLAPWAGSPTGALAVTGALALITFAVVTGAGMSKMGVLRFWTGMVPHMDLPFFLAIFLKPMLFVIEVLGLCIRHFVLAVRLLANMFAGHLVLAVVLTFIVAAWRAPAYLGIWAVTPASLAGATALSMLELFVGFLQAYVFVFLASIFIGMAVHPH